jgi:hypothetical protein
MKASERRLLLILSVLAALCGGAILSQRLLLLQHAIERREQTLDLKQMEAHVMLAESELWQQRLDWLQTTQPAMTSENQASNELLEALLTSAAAHMLTVQKKQLHEAVASSFYREVGVTLTVKGVLPAVFRWLHTVQSPESFFAVTQLKVIPDSADPANVIATIHFSRLHAPATATNHMPEAPKS